MPPTIAAIHQRAAARRDLPAAPLHVAVAPRRAAPVTALQGPRAFCHGVDMTPTAWAVPVRWGGPGNRTHRAGGGGASAWRTSTRSVREGGERLRTTRRGGDAAVSVGAMGRRISPVGAAVTLLKRDVRQSLSGHGAGSRSSVMEWGHTAESRSGVTQRGHGAGHGAGSRCRVTEWGHRAD